MTDIPIIFSAPMIRALLDGRKTMTRRLAWRWPASFGDARPIVGTVDQCGDPAPWQKVKPSNRLWVRETIVPCSSGFEYDAAGDDYIDLADLTDEQVEFWNKRASDDPDASRKVSPIHMPRWASRLTLIVTATKIEKLQEITNEDAEAEGVKCDLSVRGFRDHFAALWDTLHGPDAWAANPSVVCLSFRCIQQNIDTLPKVEAA